jgi:8-oxo-dGTP diphosphatase
MPVSDQDVSSDRYSLIPRTLIFLTCEERILLIKGAANKRLWANRYNGIGGHIEAGEDVLTAARRELKDETGLELENLWLCGTVTIDTGVNPGIVLFIFRGECQCGTPHPSAEGVLTWLPIQDLADYPLVEDLEILIPKVLSLRPDDPHLAANYTYDADDQLVIRFGR